MSFDFDKYREDLKSWEDSRPNDSLPSIYTENVNGADWIDTKFDDRGYLINNLRDRLSSSEARKLAKWILEVVGDE
jgi:hypothetical protein